MQARPQLTRMARKMMEAGDTGSLRKQHLPDGWADKVAEEAARLMALEKYSYVVSRYAHACNTFTFAPVQPSQLFCMLLQAAASQLDPAYLTHCWALCADFDI
jgi:hypothetical protein